jgi:hypothetical protein
LTHNGRAGLKVQPTIQMAVLFRAACVHRSSLYMQ